MPKSRGWSEIRGWAFIGKSRKAHYFIIPEGKRGGHSLCGKWLLLNATADLLSDALHRHASNCVLCMRKREKIRDRGE